MQSDQQFYVGKVVSQSSCNVGGGFTYSGLLTPSLGCIVPLTANHARSFHAVELLPSEVCPKNFVIFDQTDEKCRIMCHPAFTGKFGSPSVDARAGFVQDNPRRKDEYSVDKGFSCSMKEDTKDIDALLSFEEHYREEDEEEVSTARTVGSRGSRSPDSFLNYDLEPSKLRSACNQKSSVGSDSSNNNLHKERKRRRLKKMVKALKGIVPGVDQMNTATVLDEAVRYLKSLKVEVEKLGLGNFNSLETLPG